MNDEIKLRKMEWSEISDLRTKANIKAHEANSAWRAALDINTLGKSDHVAKEAYDQRMAALTEYQKCHAEALRISEIANSMYIDKAGSDVEFYRKNPLQSGNPVIY
jgi:hypothetical protein